MKQWIRSAIVLLAILGLGRSEVSSSQVPASDDVDQAFQEFWAARNVAEAAAAADAITRSGVTLDDALRRLQAGRAFTTDVPRGLVTLQHNLQNEGFGYSLDVPQDYDPARKYQVRFQLHGGLARRTSSNGDSQVRNLPGVDQIYVYPNAWMGAPWWSNRQVLNLRVILDRLKRTYNIDENRVVLAGISDGGTGTYYYAMRDTTPFASFLSLNGSMLVLSNPAMGVAGDSFLNNLLNKPYLVVNGWKDPQYPPIAVEPVFDHLKQGGVEIVHLPQKEAAHNVSWWPDVRERFEDFVRSHPRDPHPARLTWGTDLKATPRRAHWLMIDELRDGDAREPLPDLNQYVPPPLSGFGVFADGNRIVSVRASSNAADLGLLPDDEVVVLDGTPVRSEQSVLDLLEGHQTGTRVTMTVNRAGGRVDLSGDFAPVAAAPRILFARSAPWGRVDAVRQGNTITATTRHVSVFTVLLSPDVIDFDRPVRVIADGRTVYDGPVAPNLETLMRWAAVDNDRTMLYVAELQVRLP
ncbi:MAG: PDZ domain-containing protein [Vicinamibacterales bacterium]